MQIRSRRAGKGEWEVGLFTGYTQRQKLRLMKKKIVLSQNSWRRGKNEEIQREEAEGRVAGGERAGCTV